MKNQNMYKAMKVIGILIILTAGIYHFFEYLNCNTILVKIHKQSMCLPATFNSILDYLYYIVGIILIVIYYINRKHK